jgi:phage-related minor tail protein
MASQNIARLGIVLGLDSGELVTKITEAQQKFGQFKAQIKRDSEDAAKEIVRLENATRNYGKTLSEVEKIEEQIRLGKYKNQPEVIINNLKAQAAAYDKVAQSAKAAEQAKMGKAGGLTAQQQAALGYQTTDIVTSLAGGQNPMMVLLQQGGQLRDQFGGFKPLFAGIAQAITPMMLGVTALAGAVGSFGLAMYQGAQESKAFKNALTLTGNFAGISEARFNGLAKTIHSRYNQSIGESRDLMQSLVASGNFTSTSMNSVASAIARVADLSGKSASDIASQLIPSLDGSTSSAKRLNDTYHFLTLAQYKHIELLNEQGKTQEAIAYTADALTNKLDAQGKKLGYLESMWKSFRDTVGDVWVWMKSLGRDKDPAIAALEAQSKHLSELFASPQLFSKDVVAKAIEKYKELAAVVQAEEDKRNQVAKKAVEDQRKIEDYSATGGGDSRRKLALERAKLISDINYQETATGLDRIATLQAKRDKDIADVRAKLAAESPQRMRTMGWELEKNAILEVWKIQSQYSKDVQAISDEQKKKWEDKAVAEENSIEKERERLAFLKQNLLTSKEDMEIELARLKVRQDLANLDREKNMTANDKEKAASRIKDIAEQNELLIRQAQELKMLQDMNQSVFSNMGNALENFVRTGKIPLKI